MQMKVKWEDSNCQVWKLKMNLSVKKGASAKMVSDGHDKLSYNNAMNYIQDLD